MRPYKHLFFDLDHTLWDFAANEQLTLTDLYNNYSLGGHFESFEVFFQSYQPINADLWIKYRLGQIKKAELNIGRFHHTFLTAGLDQLELAEKFAHDFVAFNSQKETVMPHTFELLDYLKPHYHMHIITNGFVEAQKVKMEVSGLRPYFQKLFISEEVGAQKPKVAFFEKAIKSCNARKKESLVIGDSLEIDIQGAKNFGLDHVFFNPHRTPHAEKVFKEIHSLKELIGWL
ncbi:YjjG family noncanonical pyrimidine nucleotidase [Geofilum rubicundum]|uniref:5'-nucleotidase YjjG n=1 Tax=Geofilum rubicundum JCM 15548 TaxID=1236989 RepID=A0A0E9LSL0_9BACT|nr:YjjG family noncanonical pyrimidine nucleotidase [Geofilum rubicundum]GAO28244.1 5'-nucleotidase YjjG [Geofilum rubicundum JCM 15548]